MAEQINWDLIPDKFVIFDLETTGLDAYYNEIIEIGAIRFNKTDYISTGQVDTFQVFIKQDKPLPKEIISLTSITDEMLATGDSLEDGIEQFFNFAGDRKLIAYNAKFDMKFMRSAAKKVGYQLPKPFKVDCALELARERLANVPNYKLKTLAEIFKADTTGAHRALQDCVMTLQVYINCLNATNGLTYRGVSKNSYGNSSNRKSSGKIAEEVSIFVDFMKILGGVVGGVLKFLLKKK